MRIPFADRLRENILFLKHPPLILFSLPASVKTDIEMRDAMGTLTEIVQAMAQDPWKTTYTREQAKRIYKEAENVVDGYPFLEPKYKAALDANNNDAKAAKVQWTNSNTVMKAQARMFNALAELAFKFQDAQEAIKRGHDQEALKDKLEATSDAIVNALHVQAMSMSRQATRSRDLVRKAQGMKPEGRPGRDASSSHTYMTQQDEAEVEAMQHRELVSGRFGNASSSTRKTYSNSYNS